MSYHVYRAEGIILSNSLAGESNRFYTIYTKELGLIGVWGQGVRKLESKLRYHLQDFSHVNIQLVRGKNMWRLIDVTHIGSFKKVLSSVDQRLVMGRIALLMKRLLEEGSDPLIYELLFAAVLYLDTETYSSDHLQDFELVFVLRILHHLGYGKETVPKEIVDPYLWSAELFENVRKQKGLLMKIANTSLQQTHM